MNLKESFRYQNKLGEWLNQTTYLLSSEQNITKKTQVHSKKKHNPEAEDETIDMTKERSISVAPDVLIDLAYDLLEQRQALSNAIDTAKLNCGFDIDGAVSLNKQRQSLSATFSQMSNMKPRERVINGRDYKFNVAGDQTSYVYEIKETTTIDFSREKAKTLSKKLIQISDEVSAKLDRLMVDVNVDYITKYSINDTYDDIVEQFAVEIKPQSAE